MLALLLLLQPAPADLVIENARIWTDGRPGFARFAAVRDGRFVYVGEPNSGYIGPSTQRLDAQDKVVLPGLMDSHVHMMNGGNSLGQIQLRNARDKADFVNRVKEWAAALPTGKWVLGGRWSVESWQVREQPTKEWVDPVTGDRPLWLSRMDGHSGLANSAALKLAGITKDGPADPPGGVIDRDPVTKEPTGILRETAMGLVTRHIPATTKQDKLEALKKAMDWANMHGITAVSDIPGIGDLDVYQELANTGQAAVRFFLYPTATDWEAGSKQAKAFKENPYWVEVNGFKAYFDGSLGSRTAYMRAPFLGNEPGKTDWRGLPMPIVEDGTFDRNAKAAANNGFQTIAHAIGDEANHLLLNKLGNAYPNLKQARTRSEHTQHLLPTDIPRFGALGVIASMQPYHKADDGRYAEDYLGKERCHSSYAFKSLLNGGAVVAFGSDWPVVSINPFLGVEAAVTGKTLDGKFWETQENLTVEEALRCYTTRAAYAAFAEKEIGRISPGYRADFVILSQSPFEQAPDWANLTVISTYVEGKRVFSGRSSEASSFAYATVDHGVCGCH